MSDIGRNPYDLLTRSKDEQLEYTAGYNRYIYCFYFGPLVCCHSKYVWIYTCLKEENEQQFINNKYIMSHAHYSHKYHQQIPAVIKSQSHSVSEQNI